MNYPLISEYVVAIMAAEDNFKELTNHRPVLDDDGQPVMTLPPWNDVQKRDRFGVQELSHVVNCYF